MRRAELRDIKNPKLDLAVNPDFHRSGTNIRHRPKILWMFTALDKMQLPTHVLPDIRRRIT